MKKKVIIVILIICASIVSVCLGIILVNLNNEVENKNEETMQDDNIVEEESSQLLDEEGEEVALDSKVGNEILSKILIPNIYSKKLYDELDANGLSNDFKIMYTFSLMTTYQEYSSYLREGEDYIGSYITKKDLQEVASTIFEDATNLKHKAVFEDDTYNTETENYVIVARGYAGSNFDYIVEVPYEIKEYSDKATVRSYRLYIHREYDIGNEDTLPEEKIYSDSNMKNLLMNISDEEMLDEVNTQQSLLKSNIDSGSIDSNSLEISTWTLVKKEGKYLISDYSLEK